jgi:hypothetical protein
VGGRVVSAGLPYQPDGPPQVVRGYRPDTELRPDPERARCQCPDRLIDHVHRIVMHPYVDCPLHGMRTALHDEVES